MKPSRIEYKKGDTWGWLRHLDSRNVVDKIEVSRRLNDPDNRYCLLIRLKTGGCTFYNSSVSLYAADGTRISPSSIYTSTPIGGNNGYELQCLTKEIWVMSFSITYDRITRYYTVPWENLC